jgi:hypothetical protein
VPIRVRTKISDKDNGFKRLAANLGDLGHITLGVHPQDAGKRYPDSSMTVGELATIHELGLGVPRRSWLVTWLDANAAQMKREATTRLRRVIKGTETRKQALQAMGFKWAKAIRDNMAQSRITPRLAKSTIRRKGGLDVPLVETYQLHNNITYRAFMPQAKNVKNERQRAVIGKK